MLRGKQAFLSAVAGAVCSWFAVTACGQGFFGGGGGPGGPGGPFGGGPGDFLRRMDTNGNGMLEPDEIGERGRSMVERAGLDPRRPVSVRQLEDTMRQRFSSGGGGPPGGGWSGSRDGGSRDGGSRDGGGSRDSYRSGGYGGSS